MEDRANSQTRPRRNAYADPGAQILLGFQLRGVFSDGYDQLQANALSGQARARAHGERRWFTVFTGSLSSRRHRGAKTTRTSTAWSRPLPILPFFPSRSPSAL